MKAGDTAKLIAIPSNLHDDEELQTRTLFQKCLGQSFVIAAVESFDGVPFLLARIDVGHVIGKQPWEHTIWVERDNPNQQLTRKFARPRLNRESRQAMTYTKLAAESELPAPGEAKEFDVAGKTICVANVNGTVTAIENVCLHMGGPLGQGYVDGGKIVCPWHGWEYDAKTGELFDDPKSKLDVYPIKIENGEVLVDI